MPLLNKFLPYSVSWHVAVNSYIKHSMHCIGLHDMAMLDVAVHDVACMMWPCAGVYFVSMHGMDVPGDKKPIYSANLRKKANFFLFYVAE
jgi:hypothetical protein